MQPSVTPGFYLIPPFGQQREACEMIKDGTSMAVFSPELQVLQSNPCMWGKPGCWHSQSCSLTTQSSFVTILWPANKDWSTVEPPEPFFFLRHCSWLLRQMLNLGYFWSPLDLKTFSICEACSIIWYLQFQGFSGFKVSLQETTLSWHEDYYYFNVVDDHSVWRAWRLRIW